MKAGRQREKIPLHERHRAQSYIESMGRTLVYKFLWELGSDLYPVSKIERSNLDCRMIDIKVPVRISL